MRYSLALYCPDLKDSTKDFVPVGILVVDEKTQRYAFKRLETLSSILDEDVITRAVWQSSPEFLEQKFEEYCKNPNHDLYKERTTEYHGFISQVIQDCAQSTICFSDSMPAEGNEDIQQLTQKLFKEKVLGKLD